MLEVRGDIWDFHHKNHWIAITTNGVVKCGERAVMGKGIALEAAKRFPGLPSQLGRLLCSQGNHVWIFQDYKIVTFPTKNHWYEKADIGLIRQSCIELRQIKESMRKYMPTIYLVRPGCGAGKLAWEQVKPVLEEELPGNEFMVVTEE